MTSTVVISQKALPTPSATHITPQKQLEELIQPYADPIADRLRKEGLFRDLEGIIALYAAEPDPRLTNWLRALKAFHMVPDLVPRLPHNMFQILMSKCPVFEREKKPNGAPYLVIDTCGLYLVPKQQQSLIESVESVGKRAKAYRVKKPDSYKIRRFWKPAEEAHGKVKRVVPMQWHLTTLEAMPGTDKIPHGRHAKILSDLNALARVRYQSLSLHTAPLVFFFHLAATGQRLYQINNKNLTGRPSFTYVIEQIEQTEGGLVL